MRRRCRPPVRTAAGGAVVRRRVVSQYQEDLPVQRPIVHEFRVAIGQCRRCRRRVQGRHPLQTSDALGAAAGQLGPHAVAFAVILNKQCGQSFGRIEQPLRDRFGLPVTRGLVHAVHRAARQAQPTYPALCAQVRGSPVVTPDETGWKVGGHPYCLCAFATPNTMPTRLKTAAASRKRRGCSAPTMPASCSATAAPRPGNLSTPRIRPVSRIYCAAAAR